MDSGATTAAAAHSTRRRWLIILLVVVLAVPAALMTAIVVLLPGDAIARAAAERAEVALGVPVNIDDVSIRLFPTVSVALVGTRLGPEADAIARVDRVLLRPRLLPLLSGNVVVSQIVIDRPDIRLVVDSTGALNLPFSSGEDTEEGGGGTIDFEIAEFRIVDGRLSYLDMRDSTDVVARALDQRLRIDGRMIDGELRRIGLSGTLSIDSIDASMPGRLGAPLRDVRFALIHEAELDRDADRVELGSLRLEFQRVALEGSGAIEQFSDSLNRSISLDLTTDGFSFEDLARSIPEGFLPALLAGRDPEAGGSADQREVDYAGQASIAARVRGPITRDSIPRIEGEVRFSDVAAGLDGSSILTGTGGTIGFSNERVAARQVEGALFGEPFTLTLSVDDLAAPVATFATQGSARVEQIMALLELDDSLSASGNIPFDLGGTIRPADPAASVVEGTVGLGGIRVALPSLLQAIEVTGGVLRFAGDELRVEGVAAGFGESRVRADAVVQRWLPLALGDSTVVPAVAFDAQAGTLDLDALLGPSESEYTPLLFARLADRQVNGRSAAEAAEELGLKLPELPEVMATGTLRIDRLVRNGMSYQDMEVRLESSPSSIAAPLVRFGLMGGTVDLGIGMQRGADDAAVTVVYRLENVGAGAFFDRFTSFAGHLSGLFALDGEVSLHLDEHMLPVRPTVLSNGRASLTSGALTNWPVLAAVGERLGVASFDTLAFREWSGNYRIAGPLVTLERSLQADDRVSTEMAGSFDFGGKLDLGVVATLSPALVARAGEPIRAAAQAIAGESGGVPIGLRITGTTASPSVSLDLTAARDNAIARAREAAVGEAEALARQGAAEAARRVLGDSVPVSVDSVADMVRTQVQDRLRGLFGGRAQPSAAPEPAPADTGGVEPEGQ